MKELNKLHVRALEKLMTEHLPEKLREFREDKEIYNVFQLTRTKLSFSAYIGDRCCAFFIQPGKIGGPPGFNFFIAWATSKEELLSTIDLASPLAKSVIKDADCIPLEEIIDPLWKEKKDSAFGWYSFDTRRISMKEIIKNNGKPRLDMETAEKDVRPAVLRVMNDLERYAYPFFVNLSNYIGLSYENVAERLAS